MPHLNAVSKTLPRGRSENDPSRIVGIKQAASAEDSRVRSVLELMLSGDQSGKVPLEELAIAVNISESRLRHLFREEVGVPPARYLKLRRLEKARVLLRSSFLSVKQVMVLSGFGDASHFCRDYKVMHGEAPSQTRKCFKRLHLKRGGFLAGSAKI